MKLLELIKIDNRFEKSVNLTLDLYVQDKIDGYIPTRSSVNVLDSYINEVRSFSGNRATVLIGPYGKGKSHLLLVLLSILSQTCQMSAINKLVQRISAVNPDAAAHINDVMENQGHFLPVLINAGGNSSLNQAFMRGLTSALTRDGLDDVIPDNYYTESVKMLQNWQQNFLDTYKAFQKKLGKEKIDSFIKKLESYDEKALEFFRAVYPELTSGGVFNPLIDNEVISVYQSVNRILREKYGYAGIYIIFDDNIEFYWSRSRILEKLNSLPPGTLPEGVQPVLGPDATALGQIYWYTLEGRDPATGKPTGGWNAEELRTIQDYYVKYSLSAAEGVSEVASAGGFVKEYQIELNPDAMRTFNVSVMDIMGAIKKSDLDIGAETMEINKVEYLIRGLGYIKDVSDLEKAVVTVCRYASPM